MFLARIANPRYRVQPGTGESAIPVWGSARSSINHFQNGNYLSGTAYMALAISDVFLVKSLVVGGAKLGMSMLAKTSTGLADDVVAKTAGKELFSFSAKAAEHMANKGRAVPIQILEQAIKNSKGVADPRGSRALLHTVDMVKNGKNYQLEVLYDKVSKSIWHFKYY